MKTKTVLLIIVAMASLAAPLAAQLIAYESFTGAALGVGMPASGGDSFGWTTTWTGAGTSDVHFQVVDPTPDLSYQIAGGALLQGGNRALLLTTNPEPLVSTVAATRSFPVINTTFYVSLLVRVANSGTGNDSIDVHLLNGAATVVRFAVRPYNPVPPAGFLWQFKGDTGESGSGESLTGDNSRTHFIVIEARLSGSAFFISSFIDRGVTYPGTTGGLGYSTSFDGIGISVRSTDNGGPTTTVLLDEIRIGYTWADVVPAGPAPALVPDVAIGQAVKIRWQTQTGKTYQVQYSYDLIDWFNFGSSIVGNNLIKEVFDSTDPDAKKFYRIQVQ